MDAAGSWGTGTNWTGIIPGGIDDVANFTNNISAARIITLDGTHPAGTVSTVGLVTLNGVNIFSGGLTITQTRVTANNSLALGTAR